MPTTPKSSRDAQRVNVTRRLKRPAYFLGAAPIFIWAVARSSDHWLPEQVSKSFETISREYAEAKAKLEREGVKNKGIGQVEHDLTRKPMCFTVPFWIRKTQTPYIKFNDEEGARWQNFEKDKERQTALSADLTKQTLDMIKTSPDWRVTRAVASTKPQVKSISVIYRYPFQPVQNLERLCLIATPTKVKWMWRPLPEQTGERLYRITNPGLITESVWEGSKVFCTSLWSQLHTAITQVTSAPWKDNAASTTHSASTGIVSQNAEATTNSSAAFKATTPKEMSVAQFDADTLRRRHSALMPGVSGGKSTSPITAAMLAFQRHYSKGYLKRYKENPPRGACVLQCEINIMDGYRLVRVHVWTLYFPTINRMLDTPIIESIETFPSPTRLVAIAKTMREQQVKVPSRAAAAKERFKRGHEGVSKRGKETSSSSSVETPPDETMEIETHRKAKAKAAEARKQFEKRVAEANKRVAESREQLDKAEAAGLEMVAKTREQSDKLDRDIDDRLSSLLKKRAERAQQEFEQPCASTDPERHSTDPTKEIKSVKEQETGSSK